MPKSLEETCLRLVRSPYTLVTEGLYSTQSMGVDHRQKLVRQSFKAFIEMAFVYETFKRGAALLLKSTARKRRTFQANSTCT